MLSVFVYWADFIVQLLLHSGPWIIHADNIKTIFSPKKLFDKYMFKEDKKLTIYSNESEKTFKNSKDIHSNRGYLLKKLIYIFNITLLPVLRRKAP